MQRDRQSDDADVFLFHEEELAVEVPLDRPAYTRRKDITEAIRAFGYVRCVGPRRRRRDHVTESMSEYSYPACNLINHITEIIMIKHLK
jgi:hypothetical protein